MTLEGQVLEQGTRADRVRARRIRMPRREEPVSRKRSSKPKRRKTRRLGGIALATPRGAEIRLPTLGLRAFGIRWLSLSLLALTLVLLVSAFRSPDFIVGAPLVEGNTFIPASRIRSLAAVETERSFLIDPAAVVERLLELPEIRSAVVEVNWMNEVAIQITERPPVLAWNDNGRIWWVGEEGIAYSPHGEQPDLIQVNSTEAVVILSDDPTRPALSTALVATAQELHASLPEGTDILFDHVHGFSIQDVDGTTVYFGHSEDIQNKILLYQAIAANLEERNQSVSVISVEDVRAPYYRWE